ncbi:uncharacterized protein B0H18DRAFT_1119936 [Fomitopsis serialis]|uniref:uncharacterized protein n=1 Tax=Fomitopsis serialis TaxID=139415 RepID=UPI00200805E3|nr:uncharacterized protein B0H18DRAFT_1119936 [Neoantrodia serialis]KAH9924399.1 hypothetical protein B0H18DRAFT_1119936 [Neoantrodia serialis]
MSLLGLASLLWMICLTLIQVHGAQNFWPAAIPLAVRTPYLNSWEYTTETSGSSTSHWPSFWNGVTLGWIGYLRVDEITYSLLGSSYYITAGLVVETQLTPTRTIQIIEAGPMNVTLTFLSPIDPSDLVRQSLPFSYLAVDFASTDGQPHDVQLYFDIDGEWLSGGNLAQMMTWSPPTQTGSIVYHRLQLVQESPFQEQNQQAVDGTLYHAMGLVQGRNITWQTCSNSVCRAEFIQTGGVNNNDDNSTNRNIDADWPVFPIAVDFGSVASLDSPAVWVVGYVRDPSISYNSSGTTTSLRPYYTTQFNITENALEFFISDFNNSLTQATVLDTEIRKAASSISSDGKLFDMISLATRQVFSALEITAPDDIGQAGAATRIFMKDVGTSRRVTPVEKLYAALPMFLYFNASLVKPLLVPLLEQQNTSLGAFPYAAKDIGSSYPAVSGPNLTSQEAYEQSGNMLITVLAHAKYSNDTSLLHDYYPLLKNWAGYLKQSGLFPAGQLSIDDGTDATNSTNLALKGIFAIQAMAEISQLVGEGNDSQQFNSTASGLMNIWQTLALSSDGVVLPTLDTKLQSSWSLPYNLYTQTLLGFNLLNQTWLDKLTVKYGQWIESTDAGYVYGLPVQSSPGSLGNAAWNAFIAATCTNATVRSQLLDAVWNHASDNGTSTPFSAVYNVESGAYENGTMSPALGGLFAPILRSNPVNISALPSQSNPATKGASGSGSVDVGAITGGVVGGVIALLALIGLALWVRRRRRQNDFLLDTTGARTEPTPFESEPGFAHNRPAVVLSEKQQRELPKEGVPLLPSMGLSSAVVDEPPSGRMADPSATSNELVRTRQDELSGLWSLFEDLRMLMMSVRIERPEPSDLGAPPEYS